MEQESEAWSPAAQDPEEGESVGGALRGEGLSQVSPDLALQGFRFGNVFFQIPTPSTPKGMKEPPDVG